MDKIRVAILGVGNCASSLVQGIQFYGNAPDDEFIPGLMHPRLGGYHIRDIEFTLGIDVNVTVLPNGPVPTAALGTMFYSPTVAVEAAPALVRVTEVTVLPLTRPSVVNSSPSKTKVSP